MSTTKTYLGSGAKMYLGLGAKFQRGRIINLAAGTAITEFDLSMLANSAVAGGIHITATSTYVMPDAVTAGIYRYDGGDVITSLSANYQIDQGMVSTLKKNYISTSSPTYFIMDTAASATGHFSQALTTYQTANTTIGAGAGSFIQLSYRDSNGQLASWQGRISALTSTGLTADYVTLDLSAPNIASTNLNNLSSGALVTYVGSAYDLIPAPVGTIMPAGVVLVNTTYTTSAVQYAIQLDNP